MPEYLTPGVYVEEVAVGAHAIEGVDTSTVAMLGATERGPLAPTLVTSAAEFARVFGGRFGDGEDYLPDAINGFFVNGGRRVYVCRVVGAEATAATRAFGVFTVTALGAGAWGRRIWARLEDSTARSADGTALGFRLSVAYWGESVGSEAPFDPWAPAATGREPKPAFIEVFDDLVNDAPAPDHYVRRLATSTLIRLTVDPQAAAGSLPVHGSGLLDQRGSDGTLGLTAQDYLGAPTPIRGEAQGLAALASLDVAVARPVALLYAPHPRQEGDEVARHLVAYCEASRSCMAVLDGAAGPVDVAQLDPRLTLVTSSHAAYYVPWLRVADAAVSAGRRVPPGGHVLGIYARTDTERGVHKAPANEVVRGIVGLDDAIVQAGQALLNPRGVNVIRSLPGRGIRVWGARTLAGGMELKYVNVRRLMIYLEQSIERGLQWAVFEPNDEPLWLRVRSTVTNFLLQVWRDGALLGTTMEEAFFVRCDASTMTPTDRAAGRLVVLIGVAPIRAAEFMIFRVEQMTAPQT
jgi:phage tail sheath protein FI